MGGVGAPGRIGHQVFDHLLFVDGRPFQKIVDGLNVSRSQPQ